jgi:hypothetical protein
LNAAMSMVLICAFVRATRSLTEEG